MQRFFFATVALFFAMNLTLSANPNPDPGKMIVRLKNNTEALGIQLANLQQERTHVCLTDLKGKIWFSEYVWNETGYAKNLNLAGMPDGPYLFYVSNKNGKHVQSFVKSNYEVTFSEIQDQPNTVLTAKTQARKGTFFSRFTATDKHSINLQMSNMQAQKVRVQLNALNSAPVLKETVKNQNGYYKKWQLEGIDFGTYYFVIQTETSLELQFITISKAGVQLGQHQQLNNKALNQTLTAN
jgi:hypothetical protein